MPLPESHRIFRGGIESAQPISTTSFTDHSNVPGNELLELVWENGQVMMHGQTTKSGRNTTPTDFQLHNPSVQGKDLGNATNSKMEKYVATKFVQDDSATVVPSVGIDLDKDDDIMPWLNYPFDDSFQDDYYSELLPQFSVNANDQSFQNGFTPTNKRSNFNQASRCSQGISVKGISILEQDSAPKVSSSEIGESWKSSSGIVNFSYFSRPALGRAKIQDIGAAKTPTVLGIRRLGADKNVSYPSSTCRAESTRVGFSSSFRKEMELHDQPCFPSSKVDSKPTLAKKLEESHVTEDPNQNLRSVASKDITHVEKTAEAVVASSSACSRNSAERASNDVTFNLKGKNCETDDSEGRSEDGEEESEVVKRAAPDRTKAGSKRSRAAEVHNLSERRRRDRINEKMRALQELIPNCNKVDKASMLDEAIEYLKTLQVQVQMMYMGTGFYMPPMMVPPGMHHLHAAARMGPYSPMGMTCMMGMPDLNPGSQGYYPAMGMPYMQGTYGPVMPVLPPLGPASFQGIAGPIPSVFWQASQGTASLAQPVPLSGGDLVNSTAALDASVVVPCSAPPRDMQQSCPQVMQNTDSTNQVTKVDL